VFPRIGFALRQTWCQRRALTVLRTQHAIHHVCELSPHRLQQLGIEVLVLDFDGVLAAHGEIQPHPTVREWLATLCRTLPPNKIFLLSNKPFRQRLAYLQQHYPALTCVTGVAKKPYPHGLHWIANHTGIAPQHIALVDDRLCTGMLACALAGTQGIYLRQPLVNYAARPVQESYFQMLRKIENLGIRLLHFI